MPYPNLISLHFRKGATVVGNPTELEELVARIPNVGNYWTTNCTVQVHNERQCCNIQLTKPSALKTTSQTISMYTYRK